MKRAITCGSCERTDLTVCVHRSELSYQLPWRMVRSGSFRRGLYLIRGFRIAPSIYYLGGAGSLMFNGLRISGASGIYNDRSYYTG